MYRYTVVNTNTCSSKPVVTFHALINIKRKNFFLSAFLSFLIIYKVVFLLFHYLRHSFCLISFSMSFFFYIIPLFFLLLSFYVHSFFFLTLRVRTIVKTYNFSPCISPLLFLPSPFFPSSFLVFLALPCS